MTTAHESELHIPSAQPGVDLVGILHRKPHTHAGQPRRIALILHGLLAHKNQCYHRSLAQALPIDSYRFDFRGNGDSKGDWTLGCLDNDVHDLSTVVRFLHHQQHYTVDLIVAHSRGSMVSWIYLSKGKKVLESDAGRQWLPNLVVVSGRWHMDKVLQTYASFQEAFDKHGFHRWQISSARNKREYIVWPKDLHDLAALKTPTDYVARLDTRTHVLILHGTADRIVFEQDAHNYLAALDSDTRRRPGSHRLHLIQGADHMYRGSTQPVVHQICNWYAQRQSSAANISPSASRL